MANSVNRYFEGVLVGGILGFAIGLLTAPKPGVELRRELQDSADDMYKQANDNWMEIKDKMSDRVQPLSEKADVYKERVVSQATTLRTRVAEQTSTFKEQAGSLKGKLSEKAAELKEKADEFKDKAGKKKETDGADLLNNYMGNNSGPVYTAGNKVSPDASTTPMSDAGSTYIPKDNGSAANG